jgi:YVTN family beta-propeller protein
MKIRTRMLAHIGIVIFLAIAVVHADFVTVTIPTGSSPQAVAVNPVINKIYVPNWNSGNVTVIDGATNAATTVTAGTYPWAVAVNPVTDKIYVVNRNSNNVTVIEDAPVSDTKVLAIMDSLPNDTTTRAQPTLIGKAVNRQRTGHTGIWSVQNNYEHLPVLMEPGFDYEQRGQRFYLLVLELGN